MNEIEAFFDQRAAAWDSCHKIDDFAVIETVLAKINITGKDCVLDLGAGTGILAPALLKSGCQFTAMDLSKKMLEVYASKYPAIRTVHGDYESDSFFAANSFTKIIIYNSFPHFIQPEKVFANAFAHLSADGELIIFHSMNRKRLDLKHQKVGGVVGNHLLAADAELRASLLSAGFSDVRLYDRDFFFIHGIKRN